MFFTSVSCVSNPAWATGFISPSLYIKTEMCLLCDSLPRSLFVNFWSCINPISTRSMCVAMAKSLFRMLL